MQKELDRLDNDKADKLEFIQLKRNFEDLKEIVESFDENLDDEFDDVDSVEEDVLSLDRFEVKKSTEKEEDSVNSDAPITPEPNNAATLPKQTSVFPISKAPNADKIQNPAIGAIIRDEGMIKTVQKKNSLLQINTQNEVHLKRDDSPIIKSNQIGVNPSESPKRDKTPDPVLMQMENCKME